MLASEAEYDVYSTPRIGAVQFGDFVAAEGSGRETILRTAKYARRGPRARAYFANSFCAPQHYATKLAHLEAEGRAIAAMWDSLKVPSDFNPDKATYHN